MMKWLFWIFFGFYLLSIFIFLTGIFGWFGEPQDPLSGIFLLPLGLPWVLIGDQIGLTSAALAIASPAINLGILFWLWKR
ncbi:hypothetical protein [Parasphingorhabdus sp.]|uniref:hypothetical protein n=1 Tax=Parasphingorhabdus sp. TaxID=2709688 RepID=UPI003A8D233E|tara:strand:- start:191 stop:430 length:240 start_codon:yes stop_codon:yes gene_type:complete